MNTFEWEERIEKESYTLDQYLKKSPPVLSQELKQKYTKSLEEYKKALKEAEMIMKVSLFGNSSLKSLAENIKRVIYKIEDYLYLYKNWKPATSAATPAQAPPAPPAPAAPAAPAPTTPADTNPIVPPPVTPTDTSTQVGGNTNTQVGGNTNTQVGGNTNTQAGGNTYTQAGQNHLTPTTPVTDNEGEPKTGFFTPTNILLVLLVVGGGIFFMTRKGK